MEQLPDSLGSDLVGNETEAAQRIRSLRVLARIIARDLINSRHDDKNDDSTTTSDRRSGLNHDEGLSGT